ncbi:MAG: alpha/beta hydrolase [Betaproteobacteria bacterium]|nr:alpha/beta hydrolase [Betaproteobacteria bacterium]
MVLDLLVPVAIAYGGLLLLIFLFQSRLVYYPQIGREMALTPQAYGLAYESVEIRTEDGERLMAWWVPAEGARGTVLIFHGNAGNISHRLDYLRMFNRLRYSTMIIDYRGYGASTGAPSEEGTYRDALAAWRHLTEQRGVRPADIVLFGESLGAAVATWLAVRHPPRALVLASTFTSANDLGAQVYWFLPVRLISRFGYDNLANLKAVRVPLLIAHSREDDIVPFAHGQRLFAAANEPKRFLEMRGGHNDGFIFMHEEWINMLAEFLAAYATGDADAQAARPAVGL